MLHAVPVYALVFAAGMVQTALAPLGPVYAAELHLTRVQVGALFAAASVAMLLVTLPIGVVTDRLGARRLTVAAALLVGLSALGQGFARDFWLLLGSRALFGVAFGAVWTAGLAFLAEGGTPEHPSSLGATIPITGVAGAIGPAFAGVAAARFGLVVPFVAIAVVAGAAAVALVLAPAPLAPEPVEHLDLVAMLRAARDNRLVLGAAAMMAAAGFSSSVAYVLVPLRLRGNGISVATIGAILGGAAVLYIAAAIVTNRLGRRAVTPSVAGVSVLALGLVPVLPAVSLATVTLVAFLFARSTCNAIVSTIAYPLASAGAAATGLGAGAAIGFINAVWATSTVVAPLAAGAIAQSAGDRLAFGLLMPITLAAGAWLVIGVRPTRAPFRGARSHR